MKGFVVSDLHLFSDRSEAERYLPQIRYAIADADFFVINGDLIDFSWTSFKTADEVIQHSLNWVRELVTAFPRTRFFMTLGNHDCVSRFREELETLSKSVTNFTIDPYVIRIGHNLFLHGDMCNAWMTEENLTAQRVGSAELQIKGRAWHLLYDLIVCTRLHQIAYVVHPPRLMAKRILFYLKSMKNPLLDGVTDIYFGHTHAPFSGFKYNGFTFHNTGSGIRGLRFLMLPFDPGQLG